MSRPRAARPAAIALALFLGLAASAAGESNQNGNLLVTFGASISPQRLPRTELVPVGVQMGGRVTTTDRTEPPKLTEMTVELNRRGRLFTTGLATCPPARLEAVDTGGALAACRDALVGKGNATTRITLPDQGAFALNGKLLAFNARIGGARAIVAYVHADRPLPLTYVIRFRIEQIRKGPFGTVLSAKIPPIASGQGRISAFSLSLRRSWRSGGERHDYLRANCPLPEGFNLAPFPLARTTYGFEDGRSISSVLTRVCRVRGK